MDKKKLIFPLAVLFFLISGLLSLCIGAVRVSFSDLIVHGAGSLSWSILIYSRLPRTAAALLAGSALAVSGAVIQKVLANKLASPGIIGVNAGAGLSVTLCCALGAVSGWTIAGFSFLGAVIAVLLIVTTAKICGASRTTLILGGVAVNAFLNALSEAICVLLPDAGTMSREFRVGGFSAVSASRLFPAGLLILLALILLFSLFRQLDVLALGEETAHSLGLPVKRCRIMFLIFAALLAGASVSFSGLLGFVGLIIPHCVRRIATNSGKLYLPLCALLGGGFVTFSDLLARTLFSPYEVPVGIFLSVLGGPFFIFLLIKRKGGKAHD